MTNTNPAGCVDCGHPITSHFHGPLGVVCETWIADNKMCICDKSQVAAQSDALRLAEARIEKLEAALEHYGDKKNWRHTEHNNAHGFPVITAEFMYKSRNEYGYHVARAALDDGKKK